MVMSGTVIKAGASVYYSIIDSNSIIGENTVVGEQKDTAKGISVVGSELCIDGGVVIPSGAIINNDTTDGVTIIVE